MVTDRRHFLAAAGAVLLAPQLLPLRALAADDAPRRFVSGLRRETGDFALALIDARGRMLAQADMPGRPHAIAASADGRLLAAAARRPGRYLHVLSGDDLAPLAEISAAAGRHFYGHAAFSPDGRLLYATENDYDAETGDAETGVIGVYDLKDNGTRLGEFASHGTGPHELRLMPDGVTLAVANGGIATHPDMPRLKLNIDSMAPSLVFIDRRTGSLTGQAVMPPEWHQLSIRHLSIAPDGLVAVGMQFEGARMEQPPLVALARPGDTDLTPLPLPDAELARMKGYCGSVAFDVAGHYLAATSPRGGMAVLFDAVTRRYATTVRLADCCGAAAAGTPGRFVLTSGTGAVREIDAQSNDIHETGQGGGAFDNHLTAI